MTDGQALCLIVFLAALVAAVAFWLEALSLGDKGDTLAKMNDGDADFGEIADQIEEWTNQ